MESINISQKNRRFHGHFGIQKVTMTIKPPFKKIGFVNGHNHSKSSITSHLKKLGFYMTRWRSDKLFKISSKLFDIPLNLVFYSKFDRHMAKQKMRGKSTYFTR